MRNRIIFIMMLMAPAAVFAQSYTDKLEVVKLLEGNWKGTLSYLNFQDDKTRGTVELEVVAVRKGDELILKYTYYNNGAVVREGKDKVIADNNKKRFNFNDPWDLERFEKTEDKSYQIVLIKNGKDNGKKAKMRKTIYVSDSKFTIKRDIKYLKEESDYFNRHIYNLTRQ